MKRIIRLSLAAGLPSCEQAMGLMCRHRHLATGGGGPVVTPDEHPHEGCIRIAKLRKMRIPQNENVTSMEGEQRRQIRRKAANVVARLAQTTASRGTAGDFGVSGKGWVPSGMDMGAPVRPGLLREAAELYRIAFELEPDPSVIYQRALLLEQVGDFADAADTYRLAADLGYPAGPMLSVMIERCQAKQAGTYDAKAALLDNMGGMFGEGLPADLAAELQQMLVGLLDDGVTPPKADVEVDVEVLPDDDMADPDDELDPDRVEDLVAFAEAFVWDLVDGRFEQAHLKLDRPLRARVGADTLAREYGELLAGLDGGVDEVLAQPPETDMPDMGENDRIWVYVTLAGPDVAEGITLVVADEQGESRISSIEWGAP